MVKSKNTKNTFPSISTVPDVPDASGVFGATTLPVTPSGSVLGGKIDPTITIYARGNGYIAHPTVKPRMGFMEAQEQASFVQWLRMNNIRHHSVPNSAARSQAQGAELKRQGLIPGVPDLYVFLPGMANLAIEMKRECGSLANVDGMQWNWFEFLPTCPGWISCVAFGKNAAVAFVKAVERWFNEGLQIST